MTLHSHHGVVLPFLPFALCSTCFAFSVGLQFLFFPLGFFFFCFSLDLGGKSNFHLIVIFRGPDLDVEVVKPVDPG